MKFKKLLVGIGLCSCLLFTGCGYSETGCYESVKKAYPNSRVITIPGQKWSFFVITKNGLIKYVQTTNVLNTDVTFEYTLDVNKGMCE